MSDRQVRGPVEGGLTVSFDGAAHHLAPGPEPVTIGRLRQCARHIHIGPPGGHDDNDIPKVTMSVRHRNGVWGVRNESDMRPLLIEFDDQRLFLPPQLPGRTCNRWPIGPDGLTIELQTRFGLYRVGLTPQSVDTPDPPISRRTRDTEVPRPEPTPTDRMLLGAKFLSRRRPGESIGNDLAAERIVRVYPQKSVDKLLHRKVDNAAQRWREHMEKAGVQDVSGRDHINDLGAALWWHGVITDDDRLPLPPVDEDPAGRPERG